MKAVMLSIQPKWCELISSGKKTVEVRKTNPKLETPFKCYIYCTKGDSLNYLRNSFFDNVNKFWVDNKAFGANVARANGKVIGEFVCDDITKIINRLCRFTAEDRSDCELETMARGSCLDFLDMKEYLVNKDGYAWHISDLVIYDKPKELSEFKQIKIIRGYHKEGETKIEKLLKGSRIEVKYLTRPPQSWCYCEELKGEK